MKWVLICLMIVSCARVPVEVPVVTRSQKYFSCIRALNSDGLRQDLIGELCDKTYGSLNFRTEELGNE